MTFTRLNSIADYGATVLRVSLGIILKTAVSRFQFRDLGGIDGFEEARYRRGCT